MDFSGRGFQPSQPDDTNARHNNTESIVSPASSGNKKSNKKAPKSSNLLRWGAGVLGLLLLALVVSVICVISFGGKNTETDYVDSSKLQAVFLQTGQVYFGDIQSLNDNYLVLDNIYYLQTADSTTDAAKKAATTANNVSLVKLGCELHAPYDRMVINHDQITFWENLQDDGQVAKAVATFVKQNPNGQKCSDSAAPTGTNVQGTSTTPSTTDKTTN